MNGTTEDTSTHIGPLSVLLYTGSQGDNWIQTHEHCVWVKCCRWVWEGCWIQALWIFSSETALNGNGVCLQFDIRWNIEILWPDGRNITRSVALVLQPLHCWPASHFPSGLQKTLTKKCSYIFMDPNVSLMSSELLFRNLEQYLALPQPGIIRGLSELLD